MVFRTRAALAAGFLFGLSGVAHAEYQVMDFGDPGVPGDGTYATAPDARLLLAAPYALDAASTGLAVTVFTDPSASFSTGGESDLLGVTFISRDGSGCNVSTSYRYARLVTVNGVTGAATLLSREQLDAIAAFTQYCQTGPYALDQMAIQAFGARATLADGSINHIQTLDALSIERTVPTGYEALVAGDPGVPGDGVTVSARWDGDVHAFAPRISVADVADGITLAVFPEAGAPPIRLGDASGVEFHLQAEDQGCNTSGWEPFDGTTTVNGVEGGYAHLSQRRLEEWVGLFNQHCQNGVAHTLANLYLSGFTSVVAKSDTTQFPPYEFYNTIDAVDVTLGRGTYPEALTDLQLDIADDKDPALTGEGVVYTITVRNNGPLYTFGVRLLINDDGLNQPLYQPGSWTCDQASGICNLPSLAAGETASLKIYATAPSTFGAMTLRAQVTNTDIGESWPDDNYAVEHTSVQPPPQAELSPNLTQDQSTVMAGATVVYTVQVFNGGHSSTPVHVEFNPHPGGEVLSYAGEGWSCSTATNSCDHPQELTAGGTIAPITIEYRTPDVEDFITTTAVVSGPLPDPRSDNNTAVINTNVRQCTATDYPTTTVTPEYVVNKNKVMVEATVSTMDCGETSEKITVR